MPHAFLYVKCEAFAEHLNFIIYILGIYKQVVYIEIKEKTFIVCSQHVTVLPVS